MIWPQKSQKGAEFMINIFGLHFSETHFFREKKSSYEIMEDAFMSDVKSEFLYKDESYVIRGAIFEVYKEMGPGFLEAVYQECLEKEFRRRGVPFSAQKQLDLSYKGEPLKQTYVPDFICYDKIIVEIKGVKNIAAEHRAQLLNYMKATGMKVGSLANFGHYPQVEIERMAKSC